MHKMIKLKNGLRIITKPVRNVDSVALGIWIGIGGRFENKKNSGISHFLEHMLFKGSNSRSGEAIKRSIEGLGGTLNGFTSEECTCYWVKVLGEHQRLAFNVLSDMVLNPKIDAKEMKKERTVILEEIKMYKDLPNYYVHELLDAILWPGQPLSMPLAGSEKTVTSMSRGDLLQFKNRSYMPRNIIVVAVGAVNEEEIAKDAEKIFSKLTKKEAITCKKVDLTKKSPKVIFCSKETEQTRMALGFYGFGRFNSNKYSQAIMNIILGANMSSRLFNEVREKRGLAYEIVSHAREYQDTGVFSIDAGIDNRKVARSVEVILKELVKLRDKGVKEGELARAKEFYRGQFLMMMEGSLNSMLWLGDRAIGKEELTDYKEVLDKVREVTADDVKNAANSIFKAKSAKIALIGPHKDKIQKEIEEIAKDIL